MSETTTIAGPNAERLTWEGICQKYPNEWVILVDFDWLDEEEEEFRTAVVLDHSKGRGEALRRTRDVPDCAHLYTGKMEYPLWRKLALLGR